MNYIYVLAICLIRMLEYSVKNAVAFFKLLAMDADTNVRNIATNLQDKALLNGHPV